MHNMYDVQAYDAYDWCVFISKLCKHEIMDVFTLQVMTDLML